jgi:hypothetical protein
MRVLHDPRPPHNDCALTVFNTLGQQVAKLVNGEVQAGYHPPQELIRASALYINTEPKRRFQFEFINLCGDGVLTRHRASRSND